MFDAPPPTSERAYKSSSGGFIVQGTKASENEFNVALALEHLKLPYIFQYSFLGGKVQRGGFVADFLVITTPLSTPLWVHGEYWHGRGRQRTEDELQQELIKFYHPGQLADPVVLWGQETDTYSDALTAVRRELRV